VVRALYDFEVFFRHEHGHLIAFLLKAGFGRSVAEENASEAMTLAYKSWGDLTNPSAWVRKVAYRLAVHEARRERQHVHRLVEKGWAAPGSDGTELFEELENRSAILRLLKQLPDRQRTVLAWHLEGFTNKEIATELGMPESTVRSHLRHAMARIRKIAEEGGELA